jgi:hypothetical protein
LNCSNSQADICNADEPRPEAGHDAFCIVALPIGVKHRLDKAPQGVPEQTDGNHNEQELAERLGSDGLQSTSLVGRLASMAHR